MTTALANNLRTVVAVRGLRWLLGVRVTSQFTDGMFQAALAGSVLFNPDRDADALVIAGASAILLVPYSLIGPNVGVFLDRWSRRQILVVTNLLRALLVLPAALLLWRGEQGLGFITVVLLIIGANRFFLSGVSAALPHVVPDRRLVTANALSGTLGSIFYTLGLATAILLLRTVLSTGFDGYAAIAALAPIGYLVAAVLAYRSFTVSELGPDPVGPGRDAITTGLARSGAGMIDGLRHLGKLRGAVTVVGAQAAFRFLYGVLALQALLLYRGYFTTGDDFDGAISGLAALFAAGAIGTLGAALVTPALTRRIGGWRWVGVLLALTAVAIPACGLPFRASLLVGAVFMVSFAGQGIKIVVDTAVQQESEDRYRGRIFSVNDTTFNLSYVAGMFAAAVTLPDDGHAASAVIAVSIGYAVTAAWYTVTAGRYARTHGDDIAQPAAPSQAPA